MDDTQRVALLRLWNGQSPEVICHDLSITPAQLAEWDRTTPPSALQPEGARSVAATLSVPLDGGARSPHELGLRVGPPDRRAEGIQLVHDVSSPAGGVCTRCGTPLPTPLFEGDSMPGVMFVLLERLPDGGSGAQLVTEEESRQFLSCRP